MNMHASDPDKAIALVGATGHTGRFVLAEMERRNVRAFLIGRDKRTLEAAAALHPRSSVRVANVADPAALDAALVDCAAVINCAGPFVDTALPVVDAALRAKISYLDVTAEQSVVQSIRSRDSDARWAGVTILPAAAFFGGLADLLASSLFENTSAVDEINVGVALDRWHPTEGTRRTGARHSTPRLILRGGVLQPMDPRQPTAMWTFPQPFGDQDVAMLPLSETITLAHLKPKTIESWINEAALRDVSDAETPSPQPIDDRGRSAQTFVMDVLVRAGDRRRRVAAFGQDIYAISAPIIVEALQRLLTSERDDITGVRSIGEIFDARAFLESLARSDGLRLQYEEVTER